MHPVIYDMLKVSDYNYAIFNKDSYYSLKCNKTRLLYYYFTISTLPGSCSRKFSLDRLLKLWPETQSERTKRARKIEIINLLQDFVNKSKNMLDLDTLLYKDNSKVQGIEIRKRNLTMQID